MKRVLIKIDGMTCAGCSSGLEKFLNKQKGIINAEVNLVMSNAKIEYDEKIIDLNGINEYVAKAGFKSLGIDNFELEKKDLKKDRLNLWITILLGLFVVYLCMQEMLKLPSISFISKSQNPKMFGVALLVLTTIVILLSFKSILNGIKKIIHKTPNMDSLISIGVLTSYIYSIYSLMLSVFVDLAYIDKIYFESAVMVLVFTKIGKYIESKNKVKTKEAIAKLVTITPSKATVLRNDEEIKISIDLIQKGDIVICRPGEKIAVDGVVVEGISHIDESFITGESIPRNKKVGDKVVAGSINLNGYIQYRAEKIGKDTAVSEIVKMVTEAVNTRPSISKIVDKVSRYFVPVIMLIAVVSCVVWLLLGSGISFAINIFVSCLVIACPCAIGIATPIAIVSSVSSGIRHGIIIKNSKVLEATNKIDTVVFDKTGTLTEGILQVDKINRYSNLSENGILQIVGSVEKKSEHPVAKAISSMCTKLGIKLFNIREFEILSGLGIIARYRRQDILIGNKELMIKNNVDVSVIHDEIENSLREGKVIIYLAINSMLIASIEFKDKIRESAKEAIDKLKNKKIHVVMLSGDNEQTAKAVADELGVDTVISEVLPKDKANKIKGLMETGKKVLMVGDGINDAPSLVTADIGVSLEGASAIAMDSSDAIIVNADLTKVDLLISLSKKTIKIIKQNLFWAFIYNIIMIPIACGAFTKLGLTLNPMYSSLAMTISSITVVFNSLRLKKIR